MPIRIALLAALPVAILCALALSGCSRRSVARVAAPGVATLSQRALASLTNYRASLSSGRGKYHMQITMQVHSPQNWATQSGSTVVHIGPMSYTRLGNEWRAHADRPHLYAQTNLPAFAAQFYAMTRLTGAVVRRGGPCRQASLAGHTWRIRASGDSTFGETFTACVADENGVLLRLRVRPDAPVMSGQDASETYQITAVGGVAPFRAPRHLSAH